MVAILAAFSVQNRFVSHFAFNFNCFCLSLKFEEDVLSFFPNPNPLYLIPLQFIKQYWGSIGIIVRILN